MKQPRQAAFCTPSHEADGVSYIRRNPRDIIRWKLWRFGSKEEGFRPVHMFDTSKNRKIICKNYSNTEWVASGRQTRVHRYKKFITEIVSFNDSISDIFTSGSDVEWRKAVEKFNATWNSGAQKKSLSALEKEMSKSN